MTAPPNDPGPCWCNACLASAEGEDRRCDACRLAHHGEARPDGGQPEYVMVDPGTGRRFLLPWVEEVSA